MVYKTSEAVGHTPGCRGSGSGGIGGCGGGGGVNVTTLLVVIGNFEKEYLLRNLGQTVHLVQSFIC